MNDLSNQAPGRATGLGVAVLVFGVLLTVWHANEWMTFAVVGDPPYTIETMPAPDCDEDELLEEGLTLAECHQLATVVHNISISSPPWFPGFHIFVSATGTFVAMLSIVAGIALIDLRPWAPATAVAACALLAGLDVASFIGVINTGPIIRGQYLWPILLWFFIHLTLVAAAAAALHGGSATRPGDKIHDADR